MGVFKRLFKRKNDDSSDMEEKICTYVYQRCRKGQSVDQELINYYFKKRKEMLRKVNLQW